MSRTTGDITTMVKGLQWSQRLFVALLLSLGLMLMHGGIGQALACTGMAETAMENMPAPSTTGGAMAADTSTTPDMSQHHQPANPVMVHHGGMCVSTPAKAASGGPTAGPAAAVAAFAVRISYLQHQLTISPATGRHPPAPDLVSVLCVIRR